MKAAMTKTIYNFSAGPAMLPPEVMAQAQREFCNWQDRGISVMEISHRSGWFLDLIANIEASLRALLHIPDNYRVLFLPGGGRLQFSMVPLNLIDKAHPVAAQIITGVWSKLAYEEAILQNEIKVIVDTEENHFTTIPARATWQAIPTNSAYLHYCDNETVNGVEFNYIPASNDVALVGDMSSNFLSRPFDVSQFGIIYACAQKNIGPAGVTVVIVRDDLLARQHATIPSMLNYKLHVENNSLLNTPPCFNWYMCGLVFDWIQREGGVAAMNERALERSQLLYDYIDQSNFYHNAVDPTYRSRMNVVFTLPNETLTKQFLVEADQQGLYQLKGHRLVGGIRASLYNAMPLEGAKALRDFMRDFAKQQ